MRFPQLLALLGVAEQYAAREAEDIPVTLFRGGGEVLTIDGSSIGILRFLMLSVILLRGPRCIRGGGQLAELLARHASKTWHRVR